MTSVPLESYRISTLELEKTPNCGSLERFYEARVTRLLRRHAAGFVRFAWCRNTCFYRPIFRNSDGFVQDVMTMSDVFLHRVPRWLRWCAATKIGRSASRLRRNTRDLLVHPGHL